MVTSIFPLYTNCIVNVSEGKVLVLEGIHLNKNKKLKL